MIEQSPILVVGCPRSGTSMIGPVFNMCGAFRGNLVGRGMFENNRILSEVVKPYFDILGADPNGQHPLPDIDNIAIPVGWKRKVEKIMIDEGYHGMVWIYIYQ